MTLGENIKYYRKKKGLTQPELGAMIGLSNVVLSRYEKDQREPRFETLQKICIALDISMLDLCDVSFRKVENQVVELKPCPFCGGRDIELRRKQEEQFVKKHGMWKRSTLSERFQIHCRSCACETYYGFYEEDVIEAWNKRAPDGN